MKAAGNKSGAPVRSRMRPRRSGARPAAAARICTPAELAEINAGYRYAGGPIEDFVKSAESALDKFAKKFRESFLYILFSAMLLAALVYLAVSPTFSPLRVRRAESADYGAELREGIGAAFEEVSGSLMFFIDYDGIESALMEEFPSVAEARVAYKFPSALVFDLTVEDAEFYTVINGEYFILSGSLRVLDYYSASGPPGGLIEIILPPVREALAGEEIVLFADWGTDYIKEIIGGIKACGIVGETVAIYAGNKFDNYLNYAGIYKLNLGSAEDIRIKLEIALAVMRDEISGRGGAAVINVSNVKECSVIFENALNFD